MNSSIKIVTCISDFENPGYKYGLKLSCDYHNLNLTTLHSDDWESHRNKDIHLKKYLQNLNPDELVLFTDGYDTLFVYNEKKILEKYEKLSNNRQFIVISSEENCYPDPLLEKKYPQIDSNYRFVNSGGIIGKASQLLDALAEIENIINNFNNFVYNYPWSNQYLWTLLFIENKVAIKLDTKCELFQTFSNDMQTIKEFVTYVTNDSDKSIIIQEKEVKKILKNFNLKNSCLQNLTTHTFPAHLHFNGPIMKASMFNYPFNKFFKQYCTALDSLDKKMLELS